MTPLLVAAKWGRTDVVELLLNNYASVDVKNGVSLFSDGYKYLYNNTVVCQNVCAHVFMYNS